MAAAETRGQLTDARPVRTDEHLRVARPVRDPDGAAAAAAASTTAPISAGSSSLGQTCVSATPNAGSGAVSRSVTVSGGK